MDCVEYQALIGSLHCTEVNAGKALNKGVGEVSIPNRGLDLLKHLQAVLVSQEATIADKGENVKNYFLATFKAEAGRRW